MVNKDFNQGVLALCQCIPCGRVSTYGQLAKALGRPRAARAVGSVLRKNKYLVKIPCRRIVLSDGRIGNYQTGRTRKMKLLESEGVRVKKGRVVEFDKYLFKF